MPCSFNRAIMSAVPGRMSSMRRQHTENVPRHGRRTSSVFPSVAPAVPRPAAAPRARRRRRSCTADDCRPKQASLMTAHGRGDTFARNARVFLASAVTRPPLELPPKRPLPADVPNDFLPRRQCQHFGLVSARRRRRRRSPVAAPRSAYPSCRRQRPHIRPCFRYGRRL